MPWKRMLRSTNSRVRLGVGLLLAALFCIQCTQSQARHEVVAVGALSGAGASGKLERLAKTDHVALLKKALAHYRDNVRDYRCKFSKQERISGRLRPRQEMEIKFLEEPFSVAMHWVKNAPMGDRVLYVHGKYNGNMLVKPKGALIVFTAGKSVLRDPKSKDVMANTLKPVTDFGFRRAMESLLKVYELARSRNECEISFLGYFNVGGRKAMKLQRVLPARKDYPGKTTTWYLDVDNLILLGLETTDWDDRLVCSYFYENVQLNVGLGEEDFTPKANGM